MDGLRVPNIRHRRWGGMNLPVKDGAPVTSLDVEAVRFGGRLGTGRSVRCAGCGGAALALGAALEPPGGSGPPGGVLGRRLRAPCPSPVRIRSGNLPPRFAIGGPEGGDQCAFRVVESG
jgi:hypothetical protein